MKNKLLLIFFLQKSKNNFFLNNISDVQASDFSLIAGLASVLLGPYMLTKIFKIKQRDTIIFKSQSGKFRKYGIDFLKSKYLSCNNIKSILEKNCELKNIYKSVHDKYKSFNIANNFSFDTKLPLVSVFFINYHFYYLHYLLASYFCFLGYSSIILILLNMIEKINPFIYSVFFSIIQFYFFYYRKRVAENKKNIFQVSDENFKLIVDLFSTQSLLNIILY